jgi:DNA-directed RNA polymerase subunit RPC12/RpoP
MTEQSDGMQYVCIHCGVEVKEVREPAAVWGRSDTERGKYVHVTSTWSAPPCDRHYLTEDDIEAISSSV